jgi:hypothetical protein
MARNNSWLHWICLALLVSVPACAANHNGTNSCVGCNDIPEGAIPRPVGTYVCQWTHAEMQRAAADNFVVYQYEWTEARPSPFGTRHLAELAKCLAASPHPIIVEPSGNAELDEKRRLAVVDALASCGAEITPDRVIFGDSEAEGLPGYEAVQVGGHLVFNQQSNSTAGSGIRSTGAVSNGIGTGAGIGGTGGVGGYSGAVLPLGGMGY